MSWTGKKVYVSGVVNGWWLKATLVFIFNPNLKTRIFASTYYAQAEQLYKTIIISKLFVFIFLFKYAMTSLLASNYKIVQQEQHPVDFSPFFTRSTSGEFGFPIPLLLDPDLSDAIREGAPGEGADSWTGLRMDLRSSLACQCSFGQAFVFCEDILLLLCVC